MKNPLRFQITEFDCGTVSLLNAISFLFQREEIPAELIRAIYRYTLDCYDEYGNLGQGGTSREAINKLTHWITRYANSHDFKIKCEHLQKEKVTIEKIKNCLNDGGCIFYRSWLLKDEYYVILTKIKGQKIYIFDPYYLEKNKYDKNKNVKIVFNKPFSHNRIVSY